MQCRLPRKNIPDKKSSRTWYFNETISWNGDAIYTADFTCDENYYDAISLTYSHKPSATLYIRYRKHSSTTWVRVAELIRNANPPFKWKQEFYRTITFDVPPTGDLLTWLTANATPQ